MSSTEPRSVIPVIKEILLEIPDSETKLKKEIEDYMESLFNKAPEILFTSETWIPLQIILSKNINDFNTEWKMKTLKIFNRL